MRLFTFRNEVWLPAPPDEVFPFFADACNLERLTPRSLRFRGTLARDEVQYAAPGGVLVQRLFVARDLRKIFAYRNEALRTIFPGSG